MQLVVDGKLNVDAILSIGWKALIAAVLWWFHGDLQEQQEFRAATQQQVQATKDRTLVLEERTLQLRTEVNQMQRRDSAMRDLLLTSEIVPRRRSE